MNQQERKEKSAIGWLVAALVAIAVIWAFSVVFELTLIKSLAIVIVLLFLAAIAGLFLGLF